ncbi:transporter substrate-binding domain-containing protein [Pseudomonas sp. RIT-PI-AD]|uniref:substrate-binding periplasmic protein n=1 Tax=Pseudomonas sp. RIT-PI-AD TaxID=3035294 RepID=UPI0021D9BF9F|nr:transporter substrate-binding domain-containing protein [Pseudomonas sp. RIT-PI-AD]
MRPLLLWLALSFVVPAQAETISLTNGEWPPYFGQDLPHHGVASRIVEEAFSREGIAVRWEFYPWARALHLAERGQRTGTALWLRSAERERAFHVSEPVLESSYVLFHRRDFQFDWSSLDDLYGLRLGGSLGYDYGDAFERAEREGRLHMSRLRKDRQGLDLLVAKRIDVFLLDPVVGRHLLRNQLDSTARATLTYHPRALKVDSLHLLLSRQVPGNAELLARFNRGLAALRASGELDRYLQELQRPLAERSRVGPEGACTR